METRLAITFLKVVETGNITRSAEQLGYTQAAVTVQMHQLEKDLGVQLFDRIGRGIQLTDAGKAFIPYARDLLRASNNADGFAMDKEDPSGTITMECSSSLSVGRMPKLIVGFHKRYPKIKVTVRTRDDVDAMIGTLRENRVDFVFETNRHEEFTGCRKVAENKEKFVFVAPYTDPIVKKQGVTLEDVFDEDNASSFIVSDRGLSYGQSLEAVLSRKGISIDPDLDFSSTSAIVNILKLGYGRSILPEFQILEELERGELARIDAEVPELDVWSQLYVNENKWINPQMQVFIDYISENLH